MESSPSRENGGLGVPAMSEADVERAVEAVVDTLNALFKALD